MRVSFAGGGTDFPDYYQKHGGMVVSTAIDKYVYVFVSQHGREPLQISSSDYSTFVRHEGKGEELALAGKLRYARAFLREFGIRSGCSVFMASEMPPGSGLGSSSSLAVALTTALSALRGDPPDPATLAAVAARVELGPLAMPIGEQDQYAAAFGGLNALHFNATGVRVERLDLSETTRKWLTESILLFFTDQSHNSAEILVEQQEHTRAEDLGVLDALHAIKSHAAEARQALLDGEPARLGDIMHRNWEQKRRLARGVSNTAIDRAYQAALQAGASGGKISGAGGGGFLTLVCDREHHAGVTRVMEEHGLIRSDFHPDFGGAQVQELAW